MSTNKEPPQEAANWLTAPKQLKLRNCYGSEPFHRLTQSLHYNVIKRHKNGDLTINCDAGRPCCLTPCKVSAPLGYRYDSEGRGLQAYFHAVDTEIPYLEMIVVLADGFGGEAVILASDTAREFIKSIYPERIFDEPLEAGLHNVYLVWQVERDTVDNSLGRYPVVNKISEQLPFQAITGAIHTLFGKG